MIIRAYTHVHLSACGRKQARLVESRHEMGYKLLAPVVDHGLFLSHLIVKGSLNRTELLTADLGRTPTLNDLLEISVDECDAGRWSDVGLAELLHIGVRRRNKGLAPLSLKHRLDLQEYAQELQIQN
ncbi:hypothetical protein RRG08_040523 [Elysia crispata]|uniref:Uncharacterized protein n=1 Tax=Elysia crispata TaxID=231223 RepID=A0AAE0Z4W3_9GAST|nr:hypothetical protein RRG08_040523 [Elysia crispata]